MASEVVCVAGGAIIDKDAASAPTYEVDFSNDLAPGDSIQFAAWTVDQDVTTAGQANTASTASARLSGGTPGTYATVRVIAQTTLGDTLVAAFKLNILSDAAAFGSGIVSCFPSLTAAVASIRRDRLLTAAETFAPGEKITDDYLLEKLVATEAELQRRARCFFSTRTVIPMTADPAVIAAAEAAGPVILEPGYDYSPDLFAGNTWGLIELRQRPVQSIQSIVFNYPAPNNTLFTIPNEWVRFEPRYGRLNLVPVQTAISLPLNAFILSALGGGRTVPLMLQVSYTCGIANAAKDYPDLLDVIKKGTVLNIIDDRFMPTSGSISQDGLSQSISVDSSKYQAAIDRRIDSLRQYMLGPMVGFF